MSVSSMTGVIGAGASPLHDPAVMNIMHMHPAIYQLREAQERDRSPSKYGTDSGKLELKDKKYHQQQMNIAQQNAYLLSKLASLQPAHAHPATGQYHPSLSPIPSEPTSSVASPFNQPTSSPYADAIKHATGAEGDLLHRISSKQWKPKKFHSLQEIGSEHMQYKQRVMQNRQQARQHHSRKIDEENAKLQQRLARISSTPNFQPHNSRKEYLKHVEYTQLKSQYKHPHTDKMKRSKTSNNAHSSNNSTGTSTPANHEFSPSLQHSHSLPGLKTYQQLQQDINATISHNHSPSNINSHPHAQHAWQQDNEQSGSSTSTSSVIPPHLRSPLARLTSSNTLSPQQIQRIMETVLFEQDPQLQEHDLLLAQPPLSAEERKLYEMERRLSMSLAERNHNSSLFSPSVAPTLTPVPFPIPAPNTIAPDGTPLWKSPLAHDLLQRGVYTNAIRLPSLLRRKSSMTFEKPDMSPVKSYIRASSVASTNGVDARDESRSNSPDLQRHRSTLSIDRAASVASTSPARKPTHSPAQSLTSLEAVEAAKADLKRRQVDRERDKKREFAHQLHAEKQREKERQALLDKERQKKVEMERERERLRAEVEREKERMKEKERERVLQREKALLAEREQMRERERERVRIEAEREKIRQKQMQQPTKNYRNADPSLPPPPAHLPITPFYPPPQDLKVVYAATPRPATPPPPLKSEADILREQNDLIDLQVHEWRRMLEAEKEAQARAEAEKRRVLEEQQLLQMQMRMQTQSQTHHPAYTQQQPSQPLQESDETAAQPHQVDEPAVTHQGGADAKAVEHSSVSVADTTAAPPSEEADMPSQIQHADVGVQSAVDPQSAPDSEYAPTEAITQPPVDSAQPTDTTQLDVPVEKQVDSGAQDAEQPVSSDAPAESSPSLPASSNEVSPSTGAASDSSRSDDHLTPLMLAAEMADCPNQLLQEDVIDLGEEQEDTQGEQDDEFDDNVCLSTPLTVKALRTFMAPVNSANIPFEAVANL